MSIQDDMVAIGAYRKLMKKRMENDQDRMFDWALETLAHLICGDPGKIHEQKNAICKVVHQNLKYKKELVAETCLV